MKNKIVKTFLSLLLIGGLSSCGDSFLKTDYNAGIDLDTGLATADNIKTALNGTYYNLYYYGFGGNYAVSIGDIASDLAYFNGSTGHFNDIYSYSVSPESTYLDYIWSYGYKISDNASRIIKASKAIRESLNSTDQASLDLYTAEAYGLRAIANLYMVNIFALPYKVDNGADNSDAPGIVVLDEPIQAFAKVERSTIAQTYTSIVNDLQEAIKLFNTLKNDRGFEYVNKAAVHGFLARTYLYMQEYDKAEAEAQATIDLFGGHIITNASEYKAQFTSLADGTETIFNIHTDGSNNLSANSPGTLWTKYGYMPNSTYGALLATNDIRNFFMDRNSTSSTEQSMGAKYLGVGDNPAVASQRLLGLPEMYLIVSESALKKSNTDLTTAKDALLKVAQRNPSITSTSDLPSDKAGLISFVEDERSRELIQEGHRFQDCRRWGKKISVYDLGDGLGFKYTNFEISKFCFPIPSSEINSGFGVLQTENWSSHLPK